MNLRVAKKVIKAVLTNGVRSGNLRLSWDKTMTNAPYDYATVARASAVICGKTQAFGRAWRAAVREGKAAR
jgi:hypothetical protein